MYGTTRGFWCAAWACVWVNAVATAQDRTETKAPVHNFQRTAKVVPVDPTAPGATVVADLAEQVVPLPANVRYRRVVAGPSSATVAAAVGPGQVVYSNTLGRFIQKVAGADQLFADDITIGAEANCSLDHFTIRVAGDANNNRSNLAGPMRMDYSLWPVCPGATVLATPQERDRIPFFRGSIDLMPACEGGPNAGQSCTSDAQCGGGSCQDQFFDVQINVDPTETVPLVRSFYLAVSFSRGGGGIEIGSPPSLGFSDNSLDSPNAACSSSLGPFPAAPHSSFNTEFAVRGTCAPGFLGYQSTNQNRTIPEQGVLVGLFADDFRLQVDNCQMIGYEVGVRGKDSLADGSITVELHSFLDPDPTQTPTHDPFSGGFIPGTRGSSGILNGALPQVARFTLANPVDLSNFGNLFVVFKTTSLVFGPILSCKQADPGSTEDAFFVPDPQGGPWVTKDPEACHAAFEFRVFCAGEPPPGSCCDLALTESKICIGGPSFQEGRACGTDDDCACCTTDGVCIGNTCAGGSRPGAACTDDSQCGCCVVDGQCVGNFCDGGPNPGAFCTTDADCACCKQDGLCIGESVCRELPFMNCPFQALWKEGGHCGPFCEGGANDGQSCTRPADCPSTCIGGANDGQPCTANADCPNGGCAGRCRGTFCSGGSNNGNACSRQADCLPGGVCRDQKFCDGGLSLTPCVDNNDCGIGSACARPSGAPTPLCGVSSCCTDNDFCCNLTEKQCFTNRVTDGTGDNCTLVPEIGGARLFQRGVRCGEGGTRTACPLGACLAREGDCTQARQSVCQLDGPGLLNNQSVVGDPCHCDATRFSNFCLGGGNAGARCFFQPGDCPGGECRLDPCFEDNPGNFPAACPCEVGCGDPFCCTDVCFFDDPSCCNVWWDDTCAASAARLCAARPLNDECFLDLPGEDLRQARTVQLPFIAETDLARATTDSSDPGLCCDLVNPGAQADGTTWFRFKAPAPRTLVCVAGSRVGNGCAADSQCSPEFFCDNLGPSPTNQCVGGPRDGSTCATNEDCAIPGACTTVCRGGQNDGSRCTNDFDCFPGGVCDNRSSVTVSTCGSTGRLIPNPPNVGGNTFFRADDSLLQVFSTLNPDAGVCGDGTPCSLSSPFCPVTGDVCVPDQTAACGGLVPIACNDDSETACSGPAGSPQPGNSRVCAGDLIPGDFYYVMVGARDIRIPANPPNDPAESSSGVFKIQILDSGCQADKLISNDLCGNSIGLFGSDLIEPFDLSGTTGGTVAATFDCPGPACEPEMRNDIWYDWLAPQTGRLMLDTCGEDAQGFPSAADTPNSQLTVYEGCRCPVEVANERACDSNAGGNCSQGSRLTVPVVKNTCYKIRLGVDLTDQTRPPSGELTVGLVSCSDDPITFVDPPPGVIIAQQPHAPGAPAPSQLPRQFVFQGTGNVTDLACWGICETGPETGGRNRVIGITSTFCVGGASDGRPCLGGGDCPGGACSVVPGQFVVNLARPMAAGEVTKLSFLHGNGSTDSAQYTSHPANVDGGPLADAADVTELTDRLRDGGLPAGCTTALCRRYRMDLDRSGTIGPADLLRLIDLLRGANGGFSPSWENSSLPGCGICCPFGPGN